MNVKIYIYTYISLDTSYYIYVSHTAKNWISTNPFNKGGGLGGLGSRKSTCRQDHVHHPASEDSRVNPRQLITSEPKPILSEYRCICMYIASNTTLSYLNPPK